MEEAENNQNETPIQNKVYQGRRKSISKKKKIDSFVCNVNKSSAEYTEYNSNDEDNKDRHSAEEEQNTKDYESVKTPPVKKRGRPKKTFRANENKSSYVKRRGCPRKSNDESKKQTIGSKRKEENTKTTPTTLFNAMAILNGDRKKCLHEMGFGSMLGMEIHELPGKLGFYVIDNLDTETNVLSLTDNSILVTSQSVHDILEIHMGRCSLESLAPRSPDDPFIKVWFSQFREKNEVRPNYIINVIVTTKDAGKLFKMNFLMLFANTMGLCETSGVCNMNILKKITDDVCVEKIDWCGYIITCLKESKQKWVNPDKNHYTGPLTFMIDFIKMIQDECYNVHQDFRSVRETLNEGFHDFLIVIKLIKKFEEDFNKKDLVRNDENDDTTSTTKDKNDLLHSDSKMKSDSPASDDNNQKSDYDDGKQDVVMDEIDEQNKEDVCKEAGPIRENKCVEIRLTFKRRAWRKKSVMDNENKDAQAVELSSSIKRCWHPMKHSYHLDVKDTGNQTFEHNDANEDTRNTDSAFDDIRDEQNNDDSELSNNTDGKSEKEDEEFDALAITIFNVCHHVPLRVLMQNEKLLADTLFAMMYKPMKIIFETYEGFKVLAIEIQTLATGLDVHYEVINAWSDVLNTTEKDRKDDDKTARKYCFKTGFLQANFLNKNVDANMKVKNFEKKLKQAVNNDTSLMKLQQI
nr:hypothetical protein [Tanacetum cinerariifolium]